MEDFDDNVLDGSLEDVHYPIPVKPIVDNWYRVKRSVVPKEILTIHKKNLSVQPFVTNYITDQLPDPIICYEDDVVKDEFRVPFYYGICNFGKDFQDRRCRGEIDTSRMLTFNGKLDEKDLRQESACNSMLEALNSVFGSGLLALAPGMGKTVSSLYIWTEICKKEGGVVPTLVLCHKADLMKQWQERISQYVPDAKIGLLQRDVYDYIGKDIVVCSIQSMIKDVNDKESNTTKRRYSEEVMKHFGFLIIDEAHHISAKEFSRCFSMTGMRRVMLLTGTPERKDRAEKVAESWVGPVTFQSDKIYTRKVYVHVHDPVYENLKVKLNKMKKPDYAKMLNDLVICDARNRYIVDKVAELAQQGRQILVLSDRCNKVQHLHVMKKIMDEKYPDILSSTYYGKAKKKEKIEALKAQVIFASYGMAGEFLDIPTLSVVAFSTPKPDVKQAALRAIRGKCQLHDPILLDFRDNCGIWWKQWHSRYIFYKKEGYILVYNKKRNHDQSENSEPEPCGFDVKMYDGNKKQKSQPLAFEEDEECPFV